MPNRSRNSIAKRNHFEICAETWFSIDMRFIRIYGPYNMDFDMVNACHWILQMKRMSAEIAANIEWNPMVVTGLRLAPFQARVSRFFWYSSISRSHTHTHTLYVRSDIIASDYFVDKIYDFIIQLNVSTLYLIPNTHVHTDRTIRVWFIVNLHRLQWHWKAMKSGKCDPPSIRSFKTAEYGWERLLQVLKTPLKSNECVTLVYKWPPAAYNSYAVAF